MRFTAFTTTKLRGGPKVPFDAECIVIELGLDDAGRPLEITIDLEPSIYGANRLTVSAYPRIFQGKIESTPVLSARDLGVTNVLDLCVEHEAP